MRHTRHPYRMVHSDFRSDRYTLERIGISRLWTPYVVLTGLELSYRNRQPDRWWL